MSLAMLLLGIAFEVIMVTVTTIGVHAVAVAAGWQLGWIVCAIIATILVALGTVIVVWAPEAL